MSSPNDIILDPKIRDWVLLPILGVMFFVGILRHFVTKLLKTEKKVEMKVVQEGQSLIRAQRLRTNANYIPYSSFKMRKLFFAGEKGILVTTKTSPAMNPLTDPMYMMDMMKKNMAMIIPQVLLLGWVNYFFSGFVCVKIPFPLTLRFKSMLQRGIELNSLDVSYVSSLSWYFLNLFGLRGLFSIILGEGNEADDAQLMQQQMDMGGAGQDASKAFLAEKENLELVQHRFAPNDAENNLLRHPEKSKKEIKQD